MTRTIIVEGPDGAGKTTLCRQLVARGYFYQHDGPPPLWTTPLTYYLRRVMSRRSATVFDRLALGERVYGPELRGKDGLGDYGWRVFQRLTRARQIPHIICLPGLEEARANWRRKREAGGELIDNVETFERTYRRWTRMANMVEPSLLYLYDYTLPGADDDLFSWLDGVGRREALSPGLIGSPTARVLLVGEQVTHPDADPDAAFSNPNGSSIFLDRALALARLGEHEVALTNALDGRGRRRKIARLVEQLPCLQVVVALGSTAEDVVGRRRLSVPQTDGSSAPVRVARVPHPQVARRFGHNLIRYAEALAAAIEEVRS